MKSLSTRRVCFAAVGVLVLCCTACQGKKFYPVRGSILVNGKPAEGVTIVLNPKDDSSSEPVRPSGGTQADGSFTLNSYLTKERAVKPGAPAGTYVVTCFWLPANAGTMGAGQAVPDKLQGKYNDPKTSKLQAVIPEHAVELPPFELEVTKK